jgi:serine/threonine-protein kinase RsbW
MSSTLKASYPAVAASIPAARHALGEFAARAGAGDDELAAMELATTEAVTNVVVHAYPEGGGVVQLAAAVAERELWVLVGDDGCGLRPRVDSPGLGQGLRVIAAVADELTIVNRAGGGTELRMRFDLAPVGATGRHSRGSVASASRPASSRFSTTT